MKRRIINFTRPDLVCFVEYIACGTDIFILAYSFEEIEDNKLSLDEVVEMHLGEGVKIHYVEKSNIQEG